MVKRLILLLLVLLAPCGARACSGVSPNWFAATANGSDIINCLNSASSYGATAGSNASFISGDTVNVPIGAVTWLSLLHITGVKVNFVGGTACLTGCGAGSGTGGTYNDNSGTCSVVGTCITLGVTNSTSFQCTADESQGDFNFCTISDFTFIMAQNAPSTAGNINLGCKSTGGRGSNVAFRFHHNHLILPVGSPDYSGVTETNCWGALNDHLLIEDKNTTGQAGIPFNFFGWLNDQGYTSWHEPTQLGSANAFYLEDFTYNSTQQNTEGLFDAYEGAKVVVRHGSVSGNELGECHGTDSGGFRSCAVEEYYNLTLSNSGSSMEIKDSRGGIVMYFNNTISGNFGGFNLNYYRNAPINTGQGPEFGTFGVANTGLNWEITSATPTAANTLGAVGAWASTHTYAANSAVQISTSCYLWTHAGGTSGSSTPSCPSTGGTAATDGSITDWVNVGGSVGAGLGVAGWSASNPDTIDSVAGTRYFDGTGGACPFRDQPGVGHNQVWMPNYEWGNTTGHDFTDANSALCVTANQAYYNFTGSFTGATGTGSGLLSARPGTCTAGPGGNTNGVGYFATDTNTLYVCNPTNTWSAYYAPYTYPHPGQGAVTTPAPAPATTMLVYAVPLPDPAVQPTITGVSPTKTYVTKNGCSQDGAKWVNPCLFRVFCGNCSSSTSLTLDGTAVAQSYVSGEMDVAVPLSLLPVPSTITQHSFSATNPAAVVPVLQ